MRIRTARVFLIDDDAAVRKALGRLLQSVGLEVSSYASAQEYLERFDPDAPGCLVLDLAMPDLNGLQLQEMLAIKGSAPPIVFLTGEATIPDSVRALKHGAVDFLTKPVDGGALLEAVSNAIEHDRLRRAECARKNAIEMRLARLTPREAEVLRYVMAGKLNKQIAGELGTVEKTIKVHRARVMEKMQVRSVAELVAIAADAGVTAAASASH